MGPLPLQFGIPGGPELLVILTLMLVMGIPVVLVVLAVIAGVKLLGGSNDERIDALEQRVTRLEGQVDEAFGPTGDHGERTAESAEDGPGDSSDAVTDRY